MRVRAHVASAVRGRQLSARTKAVSRELTDAFEVPDFLLGDIAGDWVAVNAYDNEDPA